MSYPFITLNNVSIHLRDRVLFNNLTWELQSDQHWAVLGPNGSGKSMLMKALCGALPLAQGKIDYHFLQDEPDKTPQDHIAYVTFESQRVVLNAESYYQERWNVGVTEEEPITVAEFLSEQNINRINAFHIVSTHSDPAFESRKQAIIELLELGKLLDREVIQLSNGERRKVTIARAWLKKPHLLILDNPFGGLDERFRKKLSAHLDNLMQEDMRVIIVETSRDEIPPSMTHVLQLSFRAAERREISEVNARFLVAKDAPRNDNREQNLANTIPDYTTPKESSGNVLVQMTNVNVSYNSTPILRNINWTVRENERWALLGSNGAGKTTLLSLILADNPQAYANDITLFGKRRGTGESIWEIKQNIGWVAPELQLHYPRNATCLDVVGSGWFDSVGLYQRISAEQRYVAIDWLKQFEIAELAETQFAQLSESEQRLALLARALVKNPMLLVLDEPCQSLDADNRDRILQAVESSTHRPNTSMIYVTHRADELPSNITHVLKLEQGRIGN
jgi:molybdate transport system ATP-binding protein